jgi:hypothetical protein
VNPTAPFGSILFDRPSAYVLTCEALFSVSCWSVWRLFAGTGWRGAGPRAEPLGRPGPGRVGLATRAGVPSRGRMSGKPRRTRPGLIGFGVGLAGVGCAGNGHAVLAGTAFLAGPGGRVSVEHAAAGQADQQVHGLAGQGSGQRGGPVPGVEDDQRRARYQHVPRSAGGPMNPVACLVLAADLRCQPQRALRTVELPGHSVVTVIACASDD